MNPAPHATHEATGEYRYVVVGDEFFDTFPYAVVCPDGTEHSHQNLRAVADHIADRLNTEDRRNRAMTDTDRLAAIRERLVLFDPDRWEAEEVRSLVFDLDELAAEQPAPEPYPPYLVVATEYGTIVGATLCDSEDDAEEVAQEDYNAHKYHTHGDVLLMRNDSSDDEPEDNTYAPVRSLRAIP